MAELENKTLKEVYNYAKEFKIPYYSKMNKKELSLAVIRAQAEEQGFYYMEGILDIVGQDGYGFASHQLWTECRRYLYLCLTDQTIQLAKWG